MGGAFRDLLVAEPPVPSSGYRLEASMRPCVSATQTSSSTVMEKMVLVCSRDPAEPERQRPAATHSTRAARDPTERRVWRCVPEAPGGAGGGSRRWSRGFRASAWLRMGPYKTPPHCIYAVPQVFPLSL